MSNDSPLDILEQLLSSSDIQVNSFSFDEVVDAIADAGIDLTGYSPEEIESALASLHSEAKANAESVTAAGESEYNTSASSKTLSFTGAGACWWCSGTGVVWNGSSNEVCSHCGGSGIGPE
jgi:DnaJ-class molecular chaperone